MNDIEKQYINALTSVGNLIESALENSAAPAFSIVDLLEKRESTLDGWDYCYSIAIGLSGIAIATNDAFATYLNEIHEVASGASGNYDFFKKGG